MKQMIFHTWRLFAALAVGLTIYQILSGYNQVNYQLQGSLDVGSSLPLLKQATIPLNQSGVLNISR